MKNNKFLLIISSILIIYTIIGFVAIPKILKPKLEELLNNQLTQKVKIEKIEFNPFLLDFSIGNLKIYDNKGITFSIKKVFVDFSLLKSITNKHLNFHKIDFVSPYLHVIQYQDGSTNLEKILKQNNTKIKTKKEKSKEAFKLQISKTLLSNASIEFTKMYKNAKPFTLNINRINYTFYDLSTLNNLLGSHNLNFFINRNTRVNIKGGIKLNPFNMYGNINIKNLKLDEILEYKKNILNFDLNHKNSMNIKFGYKINTKNGFKLLISKGNVNLNDLELIQNKKDLITLKSFNINNFNFSYPENSLDINSIVFDTLISKLIRNKKNIINLSTLVKANKKETKQASENNFSLNLKQFQIINSKMLFNDEKNKINFLAENLNIDINKINLKTINNNSSLNIVNSKISKPFISIILEKNNEKAEKNKIIKKISTKKDIDTFSYFLGPLNIEDMTMGFKDRNLPIDFKTNISKLNGNFSSLNSNSSKPTKMQLEGNVDKYGYTKINGTLDLKDIKLLTNTSLLFKNIAIKNFTPYSKKFLGREILEGKLNLNLNYNIKKSNLKAKNSIIISNIKLGKKIKNNTALDLPLDLAIALLEDSNGIINLDLPISGNVDNPKFKITPIIWKAFSNLIIKAVTSPFRLLASILGIDEEKIKTIDFQFGKDKILVSEKETLDNISEILQKKPKLAITIQPSYDLVNDKKALQNIKFNLHLKKQIKNIKKGDSYEKALELIYLKNKPSKSLEKIKKLYTITKEKETIFEKEKYLEYLKNLLVSKEIVTKEDLINLTKNRVKRIKEYLLKEKKVSSKSIKTFKIKENSNKKNNWVIFKFGITTKK